MPFPPSPGWGRNTVIRVHRKNQCASKRGICVNVLLAMRSFIDTEGVVLVCGDLSMLYAERGPEPSPIELAFRRNTLLEMPPSEGKRDGWGWHDVVGFIKSPWVANLQIRRHSSWDLDTVSLACGNATNCGTTNRGTQTSVTNTEMRVQGAQ